MRLLFQDDQRIANRKQAQCGPSSPVPHQFDGRNTCQFSSTDGPPCGSDVASASWSRFLIRMHSSYISCNGETPLALSKSQIIVLRSAPENVASEPMSGLRVSSSISLPGSHSCK